MARKSQGNLRIVQGPEMLGLSKPRMAYPRISQLRLMVGDKDSLSQNSLAQDSLMVGDKDNYPRIA